MSFGRIEQRLDDQELGPNWEGPYRITSVAGIDAYYLEDLDEKAVLHLWNVNNLKRYYY